jgi:hypothetical protein
MVVRPDLKICEADGCPNALSGRQRKYCSHSCTSRESYRRKTGSAPSFTEKYSDLESDDDFLRHGSLYEILGSHPITEEILSGKLTIGAGADKLGVNRTTMTRSLAAVVVDRRKEQGTVPTLSEEQIRRFIGPGDHELPDPDSDEYETFLDDMVDAFVAFRDEFFIAKRSFQTIERFVNNAYHRKWIRATLHAIFSGGQQMILSPPRHGKSELLVHFSVWIIVRNPDIRIMWVAKNDDMAEIMIGAVKDHLENNDQLIEAFLGPEGRFKPKKGGWGALRFRVKNTTIVGQKAWTMVGVGWTGSILSRDVDFMVLDDVLDDRNTHGPTQREQNRHKLLTAIDSRNEAHTAFLIIGSRQHWDDFYGYLIEDPLWNTIVEQAHNDLCDLEPHNMAIHVECMLWPDRHPYSWWYQKWQTQKRMGMEHLFEMVYQNRPRPSGKIAFIKDDLLDSRNRTRLLGDLEYFDKREYNLVAGLDPAAVGHQAAWLWLYDFGKRKLYMLDAENPQGGGIEQFLELIAHWHNAYKLTHWVVETNNVQRIFVDDPKVRELCGKLGISIDTHTTGANRLDKEFGVPSMSRWFAESMVDLPYAGDAAQSITDIFIRQAINFDPNLAGKTRRPISDILMASWFPVRVIRSWMVERSYEAQLTYEPMFADYDTSTWEEAPW